MAEQIVEVLNALCEKFGIVVDWSSENVVPYLMELTHRYAAYVIAKGVISLVVSVVLTVLMVRAHKSLTVKRATYFDKPCKRTECESDSALDVFLIVAFLTVVSWVLGIVAYIPDAIKAIAIPEALMAEYIMWLV